MTTKTLDDRRKALEDSFFKKENEKLLLKLRAESERAAQREALAAAMKLADPKMLDQLLDAGIRAETWLAISLVPLIQVAWSDRKMNDKEKEAILQAAAEIGIEAGGAAHGLLETWLTSRPAQKVCTAWEAYIEGVVGVLGDAARDALREETMDGARAVAEAAGGLLGLTSPISDAEQKELERLERVF